MIRKKKQKKALITGITGITGQDGSYLAEYLLSLGYEVHGIVCGTGRPYTSIVAAFADYRL